MTQDLTKGRPFPTLLKFTLPVIGGNLFQLFYTLADTMIVGRTLGSNALAAVGSTTIIIYLVLCFIQGITSGFGICLGQRCGAGDEKGMRQSIAVSFVLSAAFTLLITSVCCLLAHPILHWMQTPDSIYDMAYDYMFAVLLGTGATIFYNLISNILRALGDSRTPLYFLILSSLLNIVLDFAFILPLGMGVAGAAWATVLSQLLSAVFCILAGWKKFPVMRVRPADLKDFVHQARIHLNTGFPMGFQMSVMCIGQLAMQAGVNALGADAIAGYTAATKVDQLSVLVDQAFGVAISSYVAQNFGAGKYDRIRQGVSASLIQTETASDHVRLYPSGPQPVRPSFCRSAHAVHHRIQQRLPYRSLTLLPDSGTAHHISFLHSKHGKRSHSLRRMYHRARHAYLRHHGPFHDLGLYRHLPRFAAGMDRRHQPAHRCILPDDRESESVEGMRGCQPRHPIRLMSLYNAG